MTAPTEIYYFSGTGNSLAVARELAGKLPAQLIAIAASRQETSLNVAAGAIGLVFPVYHGGLPLMVTRFVEKLAVLEGKYLFAVGTYGDSPGLALEYLDKLIRSRGGKLAAGFGVHLPYNYVTPGRSIRFLDSFTLRAIPAEKQAALIAASHARVEVISAYVNARRAGELETDAELITRCVDAIHLKESLGKSVWLRIAGVAEPPPGPFVESRRLMDRAFNVDERCNGCGTCARLCPAENIVLADSRPVWQGRCEQCFACLQWCPREAIQFRHNTRGLKRYHHPDIKLADMLRTAKA